MAPDLAGSLASTFTSAAIYAPQDGIPATKEARTQAETIRGLVADGKDPVGDEQAARERKRSTKVVTVRDAFDYYLEAHGTKLDRKTVQAHEQTRDALPNPLLQAPAENVTPSLFRQHIKAATQAPVMQNRHLGRLKAVLRFVHVEDYVKTLPSVVGMGKPHAETKRKRVLTAEEIRAAYVRSDGLPEMTATKEPAHGRRYPGEFTPIEAARKAEGMARRLSASTVRPR